MDEFRRQFTLQAVAALEKLSSDLQNAENLPDLLKSEIFRTLHTIKGTAQTFGYANSSRLAHELENLLSMEKTGETAETFQPLLLTGIELLNESLSRENFKIPDSFTERLRAVFPDAATAQNIPDELPPTVPNEISSQLSKQEKNTLLSALRSGKNLFCLEAEYELANFADDLIKLRTAASANGEIIATLPGAKPSGDGQIGFKVLLASFAPFSTIEAVADANRARIIFNSAPELLSNDARGAAASVVRHGAETAKKLGKQIEFVVSCDEFDLSDEHLKLVFDALLHLVRNAVDHAVESRGKIEIELKAEKTGLRLAVSDDGRGINLEKIKAAAAAKNLVADENLTEQETIDLIFLPEFSTKSSVTEISGRGVGLDAVKSALEKAGGEINVVTQSGRGARFEIFLPRT